MGGAPVVSWSHLRGTDKDLLDEQVIAVLAEAGRPLTTAEVRAAMALAFNLYVIDGALDGVLGALARRGRIVFGEGSWRLRSHPPGAMLPMGVATVAESGDECVKILSTTGDLLYMNAKGCRALGICPEETQFGMPWLELLPDTFRRQGYRAFRAALGGHRSRFAGVTFGGGVAARRWDNVLTPLRGVDGAVAHVLCVSRDVTSEVVPGDVEKNGS